jgi:hypothetical protein
MATGKMRIYFTVDTETSMGGAWRNPEYYPLPLERSMLGLYNSRFYGIPLLMDILEEYGFRATFFTEVFCGYLVGFEEVEKVFRLIRERGHDPQLHLHPVFRFYRDFRQGMPRREIDLMFRLAPDEQQALVREGVELFYQLNGKRPRAYRAGCYGASEVTLRALRENGVEIDSSYNLAFLGKTCGFQVSPLNAPTLLEGLHEFPVTVFRGPAPFSTRSLEIHAVSVKEVLATIRSLREVGCRDVVLSLHSFSLLKNLGIRYENYRPDHIVIRRLRKLCAVLSELSCEVEVGVMGEVDLARIAVPQPQIVPSLGWLQPVMRNAVQLVNRIPWV